MDEETITYNTIAVTRDTDDPVMKATKGESSITFILDTGDECVNVWYVRSESEGDFKAMMDDIITSIKYDWVQFISPLEDQEKEVANQIYSRMGVEKEAGFDLSDDHKNLSDVLDGFERVNHQHEGQEIPMLVGFWEPN